MKTRHVRKSIDKLSLGTKWRLYLSIMLLAAQSSATPQTVPSGAARGYAEIADTSPTMVIPQTSIGSKDGTHPFPPLPAIAPTMTLKFLCFEPVKSDYIIESEFYATNDMAAALAGQVQAVDINARIPAIDVENVHEEQLFTASPLDKILPALDLWSLIRIAPGLILRRFDEEDSTAGEQISYDEYIVPDQLLRLYGQADH